MNEGIKKSFGRELQISQVLWYLIEVTLPFVSDLCTSQVCPVEMASILHRLIITPYPRVFYCPCRRETSGSRSHNKEKMKEFWKKEALWAVRVDMRQLNDMEKRIHIAHEEAVKNGHFTYEDPLTNLKCMTRLRHFLKGACCGNACRHCIYEMERAPEELRSQRRFNSSFYVDKDYPGIEVSRTEGNEVDYEELFRSIEPRPRGE